MTEPNHLTTRPWFVTLVVGLSTAGLLVAATFIMFSAFMIYDDEGYVLISLRNFAQHGGLYRDVFTQYGPFPFVSYHVLQLLGLPLTHTVGRMLTLGAWAGTALWCAALTGYATRSLVVRLAVLAGVYLYLWIMSSEPTHPGGIIVFLVAALAALGYRWISTDRLSHLALLVGAAIAALLLTKINIGIFAGFSVVMWWLLHDRALAGRGWARVVAGGLAVLLPFGLMRPLLGVPWVQTYALTFACSGAALILAAPAGRTDWARGKALGTSLLAGGAVFAIVLGVVLLRGTSARDLLEGLILAPLRQPANFSLRYEWPDGVRVAAVLSLLGCAIACVLRRRQIAMLDVVIACLRLLVSLALAITLARFPFISPEYVVFGAALPCIWVFVWPIRGEEVHHTRARTWVALLLLGQCLHAFPVPGSQIAWGSFLTIPLAAIGAWDAVNWLVRRYRPSWSASRRIIITANVTVAGFFALTCWKFGQFATRFQIGQYVGLPGAELIRVPDNSAAFLRILAHNATAHADMLFSLPGMFSFNLWTQLPTPTFANVTHWFSLLDPARQQAIADSLESHPRACVIVDRAHIAFLAKRGLAPRGLLLDYINENFEPAFAVGHFEFLVHRGRRISPFMLADLFTRVSEDHSSISSEKSLIKLGLLLPPAHAIARFDILPDRGGIQSLTLDAGNSRVALAQANSRGDAGELPRHMAWPIAVTSSSIVHIFYGGERNLESLAPATIVMRDSAGTEIGLARLRP